MCIICTKYVCEWICPAEMVLGVVTIPRVRCQLAVGPTLPVICGPVISLLGGVDKDITPWN